MTPRVSIIITTYNRAEHLRPTLESIGRVRIPDDLPTELLVVDNGSTDDTARVIKTCQLPNLPVRYLYEPKRGQSNARNSGMANTTGEVILFTDDDVRVPENWVEGMSAPILTGQVDALAGGVRIAPHLERPWMTKLHRGWLAETGRLQQGRPSDMVGANMSFTRSVLTKVPAFDPELGPGALGFGDDTLFSWQLLQGKYRLRSALQVLVQHHFDTGRLEPSNWTALATRFGHTKAYLNYHWQHKDVGHTLRKYLRTLFELWRNRARAWVAGDERLSLSEAELGLLARCACLKWLCNEKRRPRNYELRGLAKVHNAESV